MAEQPDELGLEKAGALLIVADVNAETVACAVENFGAKAVTPDKIYAQDIDIFCPCAMGGILKNLNGVGPR